MNMEYHEVLLNNHDYVMIYFGFDLVLGSLFLSKYLNTDPRKAQMI